MQAAASVSKVQEKAEKGRGGGGGVLKFQNKEFLIWQFSKSGILP